MNNKEFLSMYMVYIMIYGVMVIIIGTLYISKDIYDITMNYASLYGYYNIKVILLMIAQCLFCGLSVSCSVVYLSIIKHLYKKYIKGGK